MAQSMTHWDWLKSLVVMREHAAAAGDWPAVVRLRTLEEQAIGRLGPVQISPLHRPLDSLPGE